MNPFNFFNSEVNPIGIAKQRLMVFKIISYVAIIASLATAYQYYFLLNEREIVPQYCLALSVFLFANLKLLSWHKIKIFSYSAALFATFLIIHITTYYTGGILNAGLYYYSALIIGSFFLLGVTWGGYSTVIALADITYFFYIDKSRIEYLITEDLLPLDSYVTLVFSFIVVTLFSFGLEWTKNNAIKTIAKTNELLSKSYTEIVKFSTVLSQTDNAVMITDKIGKIEWVNEGFEKLTGYKLEDVKGTYGEILRKGEKTGLSDSNVYKNCIEEKKTISYMEKNYHKNGKEYWVATTLTPVFNEKGKLQNLIAIDTDMTDRKELEIELLRAITVAEESVNNQRELMNVVSTEIRRPLSHIIDLTEKLNASNLSEEQQTAVNTMRMSAQTLDLTINDVLAFAKMKSKNEINNNSKINFYAFTKDIVNYYTRDANQKGIDIDYHNNFVEGELIESDPVILDQILRNFLSTAIRYTNKDTIELMAIKENAGPNTWNISYRFLNVAIDEPEIVTNKLIASFDEEMEVDKDFQTKGVEISKKLIKSLQGEIEYQKLDNNSLELTFSFEAKKVIDFKQINA